MVVVVVTIYDVSATDGVVSAVTFDGKSLTSRFVEYDATCDGHISVWERANADIQSITDGTVSVTFGGTVTDFAAEIINVESSLGTFQYDSVDTKNVGNGGTMTTSWSMVNTTAPAIGFGCGLNDQSKSGTITITTGSDLYIMDVGSDNVFAGYRIENGGISTMTLEWDESDADEDYILSGCAYVEVAGPSSVNKDLQAIWDIDNLVNKDLAAQWDLLNLVNKDLQADWDIFNSVNKDLQGVWDIRELVNKDLQAVWDMEGVVSKDLQALWDITELVNKDLQGIYDIFNSVNKDLEAKWDITELVNKDLQAVWDMEGVVNKDLEAQWDIHVLVNKDLEALWDIFILVNKDLQADWDIFNSVNKDLEGVWDITGLVAKDLEAVWDILGDAAPEKKKKVKRTFFYWY
jgi:hypothetical protein